MNKAINMAEHVQSLKPTEVIRDEEVKSRFVSVYDSVWGEGGENAYGRESIYFNQLMREKEDLRKTASLSVFYAFIDLAVKGLSLAPGNQALCYLTTRNACVGVNEKNEKVYQKQCCLTISGYGELFLRKNAGQIKYADNPVIVYEGDNFEYGEKDGHKFVNYTAKYPRQSNKIIACYLKITRMDGSVDYSVMVESDWKRLEGYSDKQNTYFDRDRHQYVTRHNELYGKEGGQIDTGFLCAKCVKHAFKTYDKIKIGKGTMMESDADQDEDVYGTEQPVQQPKAFGPEEHPAESGVRFGNTAAATGPESQKFVGRATEQDILADEDDGAF